MSTFSISIFTNINSQSDFTVSHETSNLESAGKSLLQKIGLIYHMFDKVSERTNENPYAAKSFFVAKILNIGFNAEQAEALMSAKSWDLRMQLAWSLLPSLERRKAKRMAYSEYENYWPTLDFVEFPSSSQSKGNSVAA
jgi:hypothetical protein